MCINFSIKQYKSDSKSLWNSFVALSKNATFLFYRDFMEYHQDKFIDYSLMIYKGNKLLAIVPANISRNQVYSHQGLSYGGLLFQSSIAFVDAMECFKILLKYLQEVGIENFYLKSIPRMYHLQASDEIDYALFILKAEIERRDVTMLIDKTNHNTFSTLRKRQLKKALKLGLEIEETVDFKVFWNEILSPNLMKKFNLIPVHSLSEIQYLKSCFPNQIKQFNVLLNSEVIAGCVIFETDQVCHVQYNAIKDDYNVGALEFLIDELIKNIYRDKKYFDFGVSNENQGKNINKGLLNWKQSFGASPLIHDFYKIKTANYPLLNPVFI